MSTEDSDVLRGELWSLTKTIQFSASHQLLKFPKEHKCHRLHGHNYTVELTINGKQLNEAGVLIDFGEQQALIHGRFDHRHLNDFPEFDNNPTVELLVKVIWEYIEPILNDRGLSLSNVSAQESDGGKASYMQWACRERITEDGGSLLTTDDV